MKEIFKYLPAAGFLYAVWSTFTLNWIGVAVGLVFFLGGFVVYLRKNKKDIALIQKYLKAIDDLVQFTLKNVHGVDLQHPKAVLLRGLFLMGAIDSASQAAKLDDNQFIALAISVFKDAGFSDDLRNSIIIFHQNGPRGNADATYTAIMMGGQCYVEMNKGNNDAPLGGAYFINEQFHNSAFPQTL